MKDNIQPIVARLPKTLIKKLEKEAGKNVRSRNAEITKRLTDSLQQKAS